MPKGGLAAAVGSAEGIGRSSAERVDRGHDRLAPSTHTLSATESAWIAVLACAPLLVAIILLLGPPLGRALFEPTGANTIWPHFYRFHGVFPEPTEHARYVLSLTGPLLVLLTVLGLRGRVVRDRVPGVAASVAQVALVGFVIGCIVAQRSLVLGTGFLPRELITRVVYFTVPTLVTAVVLALFAAAALDRRNVVDRIAAATRETTARRAIALALAVLAVGAYLLTVFNTEGTIVATSAVEGHVPFWIDEATSILNGQAPLVDFHAQYGHLWAYIAAGGMALLGISVGVYFAIMLTGTAATMAVVFATFRRLTDGRSLLALALFLPFLATSFFMKLGPLENRYTPGGLLSLFPIRYAGPYALLWLLVRRVDTKTTRSPLILLTFAGLVTINNPEFGVPAHGATLMLLAWALPRLSPRTLARLALQALAGAVIALGIVSMLTLAVRDSLPHLGMLSTFPRIFGIEGFGMMPMPAFGFHLVIYATFAAAIVVAGVRMLAGERDALTAALAWTGMFGLGIGGYYAGRSHHQVLMDLFSPWSLALTSLGVAVVLAILRRSPRRPLLAELLVLAGLGVTVCSLAQIPTPWSQIGRLRDAQPRRIRIATAIEEVIAKVTRPGEPVALLVTSGHTIAERIGIRDVTPYANVESMPTMQQWAETIAALQRAHGRQVIAETGRMHPEQVAWLLQRGYTAWGEARAVGLIFFFKGPLPASKRGSRDGAYG
jgi:hypothetical protein